MADDNKKNLFSPMEIEILQVASQIPIKTPSKKQSIMLIDVLAKTALNGVNFGMRVWILWILASPST